MSEKSKSSCCGAEILAPKGENRCTKCGKVSTPVPAREECTCPFNSETAREIGHTEGCPRYGEKTWWQEETVNRTQLIRKFATEGVTWKNGEKATPSQIEDIIQVVKQPK